MLKRNGFSTEEINRLSYGELFGWSEILFWEDRAEKIDRMVESLNMFSRISSLFPIQSQQDRTNRASIRKEAIDQIRKLEKQNGIKDTKDNFDWRAESRRRAKSNKVLSG